MLHEPTGAFFHIDFGHFLGWGKKKLGFLRDREPFILSNEMHYFLKNFCQIDCRPASDSSGKNSVLQDQTNSSKTPLSTKAQKSALLAIEEEKKAPITGDDLAFNLAVSAVVGDQINHEEMVKEPQQEKVYELFFNPEKEQDRKDSRHG